MRKQIGFALLSLAVVSCGDEQKEIKSYRSDSEVAVDSMKKEITVTPEEANQIAEQALQK